MFPVFDLSFKRRRDGKYIYYHRGAIWGRGYIVDKETREKIIALRNVQLAMVSGWGAGLAAAVVGLGALFPGTRWYILAAFLFIGAGLIIRYEKKIRYVLRGFEKQDVPRIKYWDYKRKIALRMYRYDGLDALKNSFLCLIIAASLILFGIYHNGIWYEVGGWVLALLCVYVMAFNVLGYWLSRKSEKRECAKK